MKIISYARVFGLKRHLAECRDKASNILDWWLKSYGYCFKTVGGCYRALLDMNSIEKEELADGIEDSGILPFTWLALDFTAYMISERYNALLSEIASVSETYYYLIPVSVFTRKYYIALRAPRMPLNGLYKSILTHLPHLYVNHFDWYL